MDHTEKLVYGQQIEAQAVKMAGLELKNRLLTETLKAMQANCADLKWLEARVAEARAKLTT